MTEDDLPLSIIKKMKGVVDAFYLNDEILKRVKEEEKTVRAAGNINVINDGVNEALKRQKVICIVKDPRFRPPPTPTVILKSSGGTVMGTEVFPSTAKQYMDRTDVIWLSDGFVVFTDVMPHEGEDQAFVMPPVPFPELNENNGCKDVVSCSPAPTSDKMIRKWHGMEDNGKLASILVAYDMV
jgi:hypothetical protein